MFIVFKIFIIVSPASEFQLSFIGVALLYFLSLLNFYQSGVGRSVLPVAPLQGLGVLICFIKLS